MARRSSPYSFNKRKKELARQKKQEEKRLRRQSKAKEDTQNSEVVPAVNNEAESSENKGEQTDQS